MRINFNLLSDKLFDEIVTTNQDENLSNIIVTNYIYCLKDVSLENLKKYDFINNVWDRKNLCDMMLIKARKEEYTKNVTDITLFMSNLLYKYLNYYIKLREDR